MEDPAAEIQAMRDARNKLRVAMRRRDKTLPTIAEISDRISRLYAENEALRDAIKEASIALDLADDEIDPPDTNCSCHINPPCNDCVDHSQARETKEFIKSALAKLKPFLP